MYDDAGYLLFPDFGFSFILNSLFSMDIDGRQQIERRQNTLGPEWDVWAFGMTDLVHLT